MSHAPVIERPHNMGGEQRIYRFENGLGASVVRFQFSYGYEAGLWELAVIEFDSERNDDFHLTYATPVTDDVIGWLDDEAITKLLDDIAALPAVSNQDRDPASEQDEAWEKRSRER